MIRRLVLAAALLLALALPAASGPDGADVADGAFTPVTGPCDFAFPRDHGPHPGHKTEWWYYTGSLAGPDGERYGFQFTLFRGRILPGDVESTWPKPHSPWRSNQLLLGHAALTDARSRKHLQAELASREAMNLAGWEVEGSRTSFFLGGWTLLMEPEVHLVSAFGQDFSYSLRLVPAKGPIAHGDMGYSQKGLKPGSASCYYSYPRMDVTGEVSVGGKRLKVAGQAWMDHEYSSAPLEPEILGWDWFSLRLSDGSDLMVFFLRTRDGFSPASSGTIIAPDGKAQHVALSELALASTGSWNSPRSKARYPLGWKLDAQNMRLVIEPVLADQEMNTPGSTGVNYWEGLVKATGTNEGKDVSGEGYVELTGYDRAFTARY